MKMKATFRSRNHHPARHRSALSARDFSMAKTIQIDGDAMMMAVQVREAMVKAATHMIEQNYLLALRDLGKAKADNEDDKGELPIVITFKVSSLGNKIYIDPSIEWKRTVKAGDSMDLITIDPDQPELPSMGTGDLAANPDLIEQAMAIIKETNRASVSGLQRRMRIGYTQASQIMDILEERGIVGPANGSEPREVLLT